MASKPHKGRSLDLRCVTTPIWWFLPGKAGQTLADRLAGATQPKLELTNGAEIDAVLFWSPGTPKTWLNPEVTQPVGPKDWSELPTPALRVAAQDFAPDMFQLGLTFVLLIDLTDNEGQT